MARRAPWNNRNPGDLHPRGLRWPGFAMPAPRAGLVAVTVIPVKPHAGVIGTLSLPGNAIPDTGGVPLACSLAGVGIALPDELRKRARAIAHLRAALTSRDVIGQTTGIRAERWKTAPDEAHDRPRKHARATQWRLPNLATASIKASTQAPGEPADEIGAVQKMPAS